jgi:hypothetical protein
MSKNDDNLRQISVQNDGVTVTLGRVQTTVPAHQIDALIRSLEAARLMLGAGLTATPATPAAPAVAAPRRRGRPPKSATVSAAPAAPAEAKRKVGRPKGSGAGRRSRKRVGDALVDWLRDNPGWHTEDQLLAAVSNNRMTDASPNRALKIALGKQKDSVFTTDEKGHWKLKTDSTPAPVVAPKEKKKPGRKPGSGKAKVEAAPAKAKKGTGRPRGRPPKSATADKEGSPRRSYRKRK